MYFFKKISLLQENLYSLRLTSSRILKTFIIKLLRQIIKVKFYEYERFSFADIRQGNVLACGIRKEVSSEQLLPRGITLVFKQKY